MLESMDIFKYIFTGTQESFRRQYTRAIRAAVQQNDYTEIKRNPDVVAEGMEQFKAIGNGQVPAVVELAWEILAP